MTFYTLPVSANVDWIESKLSSLLNICETMEYGNIYLIVLFFGLDQPLIEDSHGLNQIRVSNMLSFLIRLDFNIANLHILFEDIVLVLIRVLDIIHVDHYF